MNLVKNGAVLLAALGMFVTTSCGSKTKTLDYDKALAWIKENYKHEERTVEKTKVDWNYKNNVETGTTPSSWNLKGPESQEEPGNKKLNWFIQFALNGEFSIGDPSETSGSEEVTGKSALDKNLAFETLDEEEFSNVFKDRDATFSLNGKQLTVVKTLDYTTKGNSITVMEQYAAVITIYYKQTETYHFDSKGFLKNMTVKMDAEDCGIKYTIGEKDKEESPKLGKVDTTVIVAPIAK